MKNIVKQLRMIQAEKSKELTALQLAIDALSPRKPVRSERRVLSTAARKRIAKAQRERWAAWRKNGKKAA